MLKLVLCHVVFQGRPHNPESPGPVEVMQSSRWAPGTITGHLVTHSDDNQGKNTPVLIVSW